MLCQYHTQTATIHPTSSVLRVNQLQDRRPRKRRTLIWRVRSPLLSARAGAPKKRGFGRDLSNRGLGHRFSGNCRRYRYPLSKRALTGTCASMVLMVTTCCSLRLCCLRQPSLREDSFPPQTSRYFLRWGAERTKSTTLRNPGARRHAEVGAIDRPWDKKAFTMPPQGRRFHEKAPQVPLLGAGLPIRDPNHL